ncbi:MAG: ribosome small subunit-dependent GTPase A [Bacteroidales bacterium]|jgi:ribosome biogenesis GTPase|nr:ribosome small subunit-dependent GTPase A [Bacteroidales bacterium]
MGVVVKNTGSWYQVRQENGEIVDCKVKGNFRMQDIRSTNPVAVGDWVQIERSSDGVAFISRIKERKNYIIRRSPNLSRQIHILAANIDLAVLTITVNYPPTSTVFVDRFLCASEAYHIPVLLVINKTDVYNSSDTEYMNELMYLYETVGYPCVAVSAATGDGINDLRDRLRGKVSLFSGNSGVGKSTLINALIPGINLKTSQISSYHNKGMHTTTFSEMIALPSGGYVIDTPGIKGFGAIDMSRNEIGHYFKEIFEVSSGCRYYNCTHLHEPDCAVLTAVAARRISESRYKSYTSILGDMDDGKYR